MPQDMSDNGADVSDPVSENEEDSETLLKDEDERMADPMAANGYDDKKKYDPKDPLRPRRKKARRACFACQRAHLTCGASFSGERASPFPLPFPKPPLATQFLEYPIELVISFLGRVKLSIPFASCD